MDIQLADNIKAFRKGHKMTQEQLADALGVTTGAVYKWEAGLSVPEIRLIMEMADIFDSSVDSLLGYVRQNGSVNSRIKRIKDLTTAKRFEEASVEAEKALRKYPHNAELVYTCAFMYMVKTADDKCLRSLEKSNDLYERAITLIGPDTSPDISEMTIRNHIATNYMSVGDIEKALEILKKYNANNINGSMISYLYSVEMNRPDESLEYGKKTIVMTIISVVRTVWGLSFAYAEKKNEECISSLIWFCDFLDSLKEDPDVIVYTDKFKAISLALIAVWENMFGYKDQAVVHIRQAYELASAFDSSPSCDAHGLRFIGDMKGKLIDSFGDTVCGAVDSCVFSKVPVNNASSEIKKLWEGYRK